MKKLTAIILVLIISLSATAVAFAEETSNDDKYEKFTKEINQYRHNVTEEELNYDFCDHEVITSPTEKIAKKIADGEIIIDKNYFARYNIEIEDVICFPTTGEPYYIYIIILYKHDCANVLKVIETLKKDDNFMFFEPNYLLHIANISANPMKVSTAVKTVKYSKVKKAKQTVAPITVKKAKGKVSYKRISGSKKLTLKSNGKIVVKKGTKKGTYSLKVKITAQGTTKYKSKSKNVTVKIKVK